MLKIWQFSEEFQVKCDPLSLYILILSTDEQVYFVLEEGLWNLENNLMLFQQWIPDVSIHEVESSSTNFWIWLYGMPSSNWTHANAQWIASLFDGLV